MTYQEFCAAKASVSGKSGFHVAASLRYQDGPSWSWRGTEHGLLFGRREILPHC